MKYRILLIFLSCLILTGAKAQYYHQPNILLGQKDTTKIDTSLTEDEIFKSQQIQNMDSLLNLWYIKCELSNKNSTLSQLKDDTAAYDNNDSTMSQRLSQIVTAVPMAYNDRVKRFIELYSVQRKRSSSAMLGLAQYYYPWMKEIFDKYDVPEELIYVTIIESGLNTNAVSPVGATGIWQFMYSTGKLYGLDVNTFVDDRRDPYKATDAAARHFRDLYNIFNDWGLAISAYNCGAGNVRKAIQRSGGKTDFWGVYKYLPQETQNYFPAFIGAYYMMTYHHLYGIEPASIAIPSTVDTVMVNKEMSFDQIAAVLNINLNEIKTLNPQYKRQIIPAYTQSYPLRLRSNDIIRFIAMEDSIHNYRYNDYFTPTKILESAPAQTTNAIAQNSTTTKTVSNNKYYYVKKGDNLSKISNRYGLTVNELKNMNHLRSNTVSVNQKLLVNRGTKTIQVKTPISATNSTQLANKPTSKNNNDNLADNIQTSRDTTAVTKTDTPKIKPIQAAQPKPIATYVVKKGDTLTSIAQRYGADAELIANYNKLQNKDALRVGQKIVIPHGK